MTPNLANTLPEAALPLRNVFDRGQLDALLQRIEASGVMGRSRIYGELLEYLVTAALGGRSPKELEIALDVLRRNASFDVSRDSVVRVYLHQLRKRLDRYYQVHEPTASYRIVIPKGQYLVAARPNPPTPALSEIALTDSNTKLRMIWRRHSVALMAALLIGILLSGNLAQYLSREQRDRAERTQARTQALSHPMWQAIVDDELPVLIVMGDYYIFGEQDESERVTRMIRDFSINSARDLNVWFMAEPEAGSRYRDLNLNYLPEGSAQAVAHIISVMPVGRKPVRVTMMSKLNTEDLRSNHIIYLGYLSALDRLSRLVFASSGLQIGRTYDELFNRGSGEIYSSDAGLPAANQSFRDFGLLSTFPAPAGNHFVIIAGTRDAGLVHTAQSAIDGGRLQQITRTLIDQEGVSARVRLTPDLASFEALFEVFGFERTSFDANLVYSRQLDARRIWSGEASL
jgi:hypothetical protein